MGETGPTKGEDPVADLRAALRNRRFSRTKGLRAIVEFSNEYAKNNGAPVLSYAWLVKFAEGRISDPGFDRALRLRTLLEVMDLDQP